MGNDHLVKNYHKKIRRRSHTPSLDACAATAACVGGRGVRNTPAGGALLPALRRGCTALGFVIVNRAFSKLPPVSSRKKGKNR